MLLQNEERIYNYFGLLKAPPKKLINPERYPTLMTLDYVLQRESDLMTMELRENLFGKRFGQMREQMREKQSIPALILSSLNPVFFITLSRPYGVMLRNELL